MSEDFYWVCPYCDCEVYDEDDQLHSDVLDDDCCPDCYFAAEAGELEKE